MNSNNDIKELKKQERSHVSWAIFIWAIGLLLVGIGWNLSRTAITEAVAQEAKNGISELKGEIGIIKTNVEWIRQIMEKNNRLQPISK